MDTTTSLRLFLLSAFLILGSFLDLQILSFFILVRNWEYLKQTASQYIDRVFVIDAIKCLLSWSILRQTIRFVRGLLQHNSVVPDGIPKPLLFPCRTSHTRLFPSKHTFTYSYLLAGIPIGWKGSVGGFLSADVQQKPESWLPRWFSLKPPQDSTWYTVDPADYLERGYVHLGLEGKLERYLRSQNARREDYPYVYLLTAPKLMGYVSNPVSLWCMYSSKRELTAMVLEVNNTFNERRMYFVKEDDLVPPSIDKDLEFDWQNIEKAAYEFDAAQRSGKPTKSKIFSRCWTKDFYVSPLNSRKGSYSLLAYDPFYPAMTGSGPLNATITLNSNNAHAKLVARVFSTGAALNPANMSVLAKTKFLAAWWWVSFATFFPRTVWQAGVLVAKRKLQFLTRPEPLKGTVGRPADNTEEAIESVFREYLRHLVENAIAPVIVRYIPAGLHEAQEEIMISPAAQLVPGGVEELEIKILTPLFYARFVHYTDDIDAFSHEFHQSRTVWLSNPLILLDFIPNRPQGLSHPERLTRFDATCFAILQKLRMRPAPIEGASIAKDAKKPSPPFVPMRAIYSNQYTGLEAFIVNDAHPKQQASYMYKVLWLFIADHIALGSLDLLGLELFLIHCLVAWMLARSCVL